MGNREESAAQELIASLSGVRLFQSDTGEPYVSIPVGRAFHVCPVGGKEFRRFVSHHAYQKLKKLVPANTINLLVSHLEAEAAAIDRRIPLDIRFARRDETLWLDLVDNSRRAVKITQEGWKVVRLRRIIFKRYPHQLEIPKPKHGGDVRQVFKYLNIAGDHQQLLLLAWLGCMFIADVPRPIPSRG